MRNWRQLSTQCNISDAYRGSLFISSARSRQVTSWGVRARLSTRRTLGTCLIFQSTRVWTSLCCYWHWCLRLNNSTLSDKRLQPYWARYWHFSPHSSNHRHSQKSEIMTIGCLRVLLHITVWHKARKHGVAISAAMPTCSFSVRMIMLTFCCLLHHCIPILSELQWWRRS